MFADKLFAVNRNSVIQQFRNGIVWHRCKQFVLQHAAVAPGVDRPRHLNEEAFDQLAWLDIVVAQDGHAVAKRAKGVCAAVDLIDPSGVDKLDARCRHGGFALTRTDLVQAAQQTDFARPLTDDDG